MNATAPSTDSPSNAWSPLNGRPVNHQVEVEVEVEAEAEVEVEEK